MTNTVWLCRRCATVFACDDGDEPSPDVVLAARLAHPQKTARRTVHDCGHGAFGVADLVGAVPGKENG